MEESEAILVEKYLIEYRTRAFAYFYTKQEDVRFHNHAAWDKHVPIGRHEFPALTEELCKRPYFDLPVSLSDKERRHIHALCSTLDLYHCGAGEKPEKKREHTENGDTNHTATTNQRRIVVSIFANGLDYVHDLEAPHQHKESFPSRRCRPWYNRASFAINRYDNHDRNINLQSKSSFSNDDNLYSQRIMAIEEEKKLISMLVKYPEQSLRTSLRNSIAVSNNSDTETHRIDSLDMGELESLDLSKVATPKDCPWMLVDTVEKLKECAEELMYGVNHKEKNPKRLPLLHELAFDMEIGGSESVQKSALRTCLIQLTSNVETKDYVIDPLAPGVWDAIPIHLGPLFSNPNIVKIGHGISGMDTISLHRDFGIVVVNAFDTYEASAVLLARTKNGGLGLAKLCKHYGLPSWKEYEELKASFQCSDWRKRPLDERALVYGRFDVRCLTLLRKLLMRDLVQMDMIGGKNPFGYIRKQFSSISASVASQKISDTEAFLTSGQSSYDESGSNFDTFSESIDPASSFDEFKDAKESFRDSIVTDDESVNEFVDARDVSNSPSAPAKQQSQILDASDLPAFHHLMKALKISHKRCLSIWTGDDDEQILKHPALLSMVEQSSTGKGQGKFWTEAHHKLYVTLTKWRLSVAEREKFDAFEVCSLNFLVHVAYKLPVDFDEMRRFAYFLPELLEDSSLPYCRELCELISSSDVFSLQSKPPLSEMMRFPVVYYSESNKKRKQRVAWAMLSVAAVIGIAIILLTRTKKK